MKEISIQNSLIKVYLWLNLSDINNNIASKHYSITVHTCDMNEIKDCHYFLLIIYRKNVCKIVWITDIAEPVVMPIKIWPRSWGHFGFLEVILISCKQGISFCHNLFNYILVLVTLSNCVTGICDVFLVLFHFYLPAKILLWLNLTNEHCEGRLCWDCDDWTQLDFIVFMCKYPRFSRHKAIKSPVLIRWSWDLNCVEYSNVLLSIPVMLTIIKRKWIFFW